MEFARNIYTRFSCILYCNFTVFNCIIYSLMFGPLINKPLIFTLFFSEFLIKYNSIFTINASSFFNKTLWKLRFSNFSYRFSLTNFIYIVVFFIFTFPECYSRFFIFKIYSFFAIFSIFLS